MAKITLRHIEIFHAVMTSTNVTAAASRLHTSQPTISRELARFEKLTGLVLFQRIRGRLHPTMQALHLFEEVRHAWHSLDRVISTAENLRQFRQGKLAIACLPVFAQSFLPQICRAFLQHYPDISLQIIPLESPQLEEWLTAQRYDLGITETQQTPGGTERRMLFCHPQVCVLPYDHPLAAKSVLTPEDFNDEKFISLSRNDGYRQALDALFHQHHVRRKKVMETHNAAAVCAMVKAGIGVSIVNPLTARDYVDNGVLVRRFSVDIPFTVSLILPRHRPACLLADRFSEYLYQQSDRILKQLTALCR